MTESDLIRIAVEYANEHGVMLNSPKALGDCRVCSFWKPSEVAPGRRAASQFFYFPMRLSEHGYEAEFRAGCEAALMLMEECEARGRVTGVPQQ